MRTGRPKRGTVYEKNCGRSDGKWGDWKDGKTGRAEGREAAQEQVMQDGSEQDGNDMPMVQRM